ncbi:MAG: SAM-dependent methyltransferase, partial [Actinomycetota bacterium]
MTTTIDRKDTAATEAFADQVFGGVLQMATSVSIYIGEKLGLYRALADHGPLTRDELTRHAPIHWRYAQEWLEQQTVAGILTTDNPEAGPEARRYSLPGPQAEVLLDRDSLFYLAPFVRLVMSGATAVPALLEAYRTGGGVSWAELGADARTGQGDMNRPWYLHALGSEWFPNAPEVHEALTRGGRVADIACGEGWSTIGIALAYPDTEVDGYDVDGPSIEAARRHAAEMGVSDRVRFHHLDAAELTQEGVYDVVVGFE